MKAPIFLTALLVSNLSLANCNMNDYSFVLEHEHLAIFNSLSDQEKNDLLERTLEIDNQGQLYVPNNGTEANEIEHESFEYDSFLDRLQNEGIYNEHLSDSGTICV